MKGGFSGNITNFYDAGLNIPEINLAKSVRYFCWLIFG